MAAKLTLSFLAFVLFALAGCSSGGGAHGTIEIHESTFDPATVTVSAGEEVHVQNHDSFPHTVTSDTSGQFNTGNIAGGADGHFDAPGTAGTYAFHCALHPNMKGTLKVE